jgi:4-amino-4-deoxy-L-arabinose transferase-like glycosyltransferase
MRRHAWWLPALLWLALVIATLFTRPLWPLDETRYASVAWEMWLRGDFLVPYLNGAPYSHKPPLLFWLIQLGWSAFGVNDWWPRLVPALFALANLFLCAHLARRLWPDEGDTGPRAVWLLFGAALWLTLIGPLMFDMLLVFAVLLGMIGVQRAWAAERGWDGWLVVGAAIGLGLLAKGPVILLHVLPVALLAPWWASGPRPARWGRWYAGIGIGVTVGAAIALVWAIPAARAGGPEYHNAIFWGQTAGRVAESFAHRHPWWWYLPLLPLIVFPWSLWPPVWRALAGVRSQARNTGVRFCLAWSVPVFIGLSLISGKQVHYLLPLLPAFALLVGHGLAQRPPPAGRWPIWPVSLGWIVIGGSLLALPLLAPRLARLPAWAADISPLAGTAFMLAALALLAIPRNKDHRFRVPALSVAAALLAMVAHTAVLPAASATGDLRPIGRYLRTLQDRGIPLAQYGKYPGQFNFIGRLEKPIPVIRAVEIEAWIKRNPDGKLIAVSENWQEPVGHVPEFEQPFRTSRVAVWDAAAALAAADQPLEILP